MEQTLDCKVVDSIARTKVYVYVGYEQDESITTAVDWSSLGKLSLSEQADCLIALGTGIKRVATALAFHSERIRDELLRH